MQQNETSIEIRLVGEGIAPGQIRSRDLAEFMTWTETMVASLVSAENKDIAERDIIVGLSSLEPGSVNMRFQTDMPSYVIPAFEKASDAIKRNVYDGLPERTIESILELAKVTRRVRCNTEFWEDNGQRHLLATITPDFALPQPSLLSGGTTLYARVIRVGGKDPKAAVETLQGETLTCTTTRGIATELGKRLYQVVGLEGVAKWDSETSEIREFEIRRITEYEEMSPLDALKHLAQSFGDAYDDITDVDSYVKSLRQGDM